MALALGLCGCGVMGRRHLLGLRELQQIGRLQFDLVGLVDPVVESAERLAGLAEELLGHRPSTFTSLAGLQRAVPLDAIDVTTAPDLHADIAIAALETGIHVIVEKPIALTIEQGARMLRAAAAAERHLAVAENYRRDPINRLARALLDAGAIGRPYLIVQSSSGSGEHVIITPWRHRKQSGGIVVDMGIHYADLLEYFLGPVDTVVGMSAVVDDRRRDTEGRWHLADAEDLTAGVMRFASGAIGNLLLNLAGRGHNHASRVIHGTAGSLSIPNDRSGHPLRLSMRHDGTDTMVSESEQLGLVPDFALESTTAALFGGERLSSYDLPWAEIDASLLAIELDDFAEAILTGRAPEVDGSIGQRSLAIVYGFLESERLGRIISVDKVLRGDAAAYQQTLASVGEEQWRR